MADGSVHYDVLYLTAGHKAIVTPEGVEQRRGWGCCENFFAGMNRRMGFRYYICKDDAKARKWSDLEIAEVHKLFTDMGFQWTLSEGSLTLYDGEHPAYIFTVTEGSNIAKVIQFFVARYFVRDGGSLTLKTFLKFARDQETPLSEVSLWQRFCLASSCAEYCLGFSHCLWDLQDDEEFQKNILGSKKPWTRSAHAIKMYLLPPRDFSVTYSPSWWTMYSTSIRRPSYTVKKALKRYNQIKQKSKPSLVDQHVWIEREATSGD